MEPIALTSTPSAPIAIPAGALLQNSGSALIFVRPASAAPSHAPLRIPKNKAFRISEGTMCVAWALGPTGQLSIITGL